MTIIGITGGTGSGKTTLLNEIMVRGALVIDCDKVYHELLRDSADMKREIGLRFDGVIKNGALDRKALGEIVFSDPAALSELNAITHKYVKLEVEKLIGDWEAEGGSIVAIDAIALIESGIGDMCDTVIGVIAPKEIRAKRIMEREGIGYDYAMKRIMAQQPDNFYENNCDITVLNESGSLEEFKRKCRDLLDKILGGSING